MSICISLWLTCYRIPNEAITLWILFEDNESTKKIKIDKQNLTQGHSIMFSGSVRLKFIGQISSMALSCSGLNGDIPFKVESFELKQKNNADTAIKI